MITSFYQWLDLLWLPVAWYFVHKQHRWMTIGFIVACLFTYRTQVQLMEGIGYSSGILSWMESSVYARGLITYNVVIALFLVLAHYSQKTFGSIFLAAMLSIYIFTFCFSMILMIF